jgi:uncharacterized membrane protein YvbJ
MSLMKCVECAHDVSSSAAACPNCGAPVNSQGIQTPLTTVQQTSKNLKIHVIIYNSLIWFGLAFAFVNPLLGIPIFFIGIIWCIATKLRTWWHHS